MKVNDIGSQHADYYADLVLGASKTIFLSAKVRQFVCSHPVLVLDESKSIFKGLN